MRIRVPVAAGILAALGVTAAAAGFVVQGQDPGKVAVCHKTGSAGKQFVKIRVSRSALGAHTRHDGDIVLMDENASCPPNTPTPPAGASSPGKAAICHKTSSAKKPFVKIRVSTSAIGAHTSHSGDMVLMDEDASCPTSATTSNTTESQAPKRGKKRGGRK